MTRKSIDLSRIPPPDVVEELDFERIKQAIVDDLKERLGDTEPFELESEPLVKLIEAAAYRVLLMQQRINDKARAVMLTTAVGTDLDNLAALLNVARQEGESDDRFRVRIQLAHESYTAAGAPGAYEWHAFDASQQVVDVAVQQPIPGRVDVVVLGPDGRLPESELKAVRERLHRDDVKPLTDMLEVRNVTVVPFDLRARLWLYIDPDAQTVMTNARASLQDYMAQIHKLGWDATTSGLISALHVDGVQHVILDEPATNVVVANDQVARLNNADLTLAGRAE